MGANSSETALVDSMTPNCLPAVMVEPTLGSSTYTTSPSASCACAVTPTTTRFPCWRAHSWSFVYFRSWGMESDDMALLLERGLRLLPERRLHDLGGHGPAADIHIEGRALGGQLGGHVANADGLLHGGAHGAARHLAHLLPALHDGVAVAGDAAAREFEA